MVMTSRDCRYAITDVNTSKETTCRPDRRQTLLQQMNLPFVPLIVAPFVPAVPGLVQMAPPPVPCTTPTPTPLSSAARRPACQAHIQRSGRIDTSAATACQTPMDMYKLYNSNKEVLVPMLALNQPLPPTSYSNSHFVNKLSRKTLLALVGPRPAVPYHPFFSLAFHRTKDTLHRMPRQPWIINSSVHGLCILLSCCRVSPRIATSVPAPSTPHSVQEP